MAKLMMAFLAVLFLCFGCASTGTLVTEEQFAQLEIGKSTCDDVVSLLGDPQDIDLDDNGNRIFVYEYKKARAKAVNFIPYIGIFAGGSNTTKTKSKLYFTRECVLKDTLAPRTMEDEVKSGVISD